MAGADIDEAPIVHALVDSGAWRTLLPMSIATELGIEDKLLEDDERGGGVGSSFPTWSFPSGGLTGQLHLDDQGLWGRPFPLEPGFAAIEFLPLLGRADFFRAFRIRFDEVREFFELEDA